MRLVSVWNGWKVVFHAATTQRSSRIWDDSAREQREREREFREFQSNFPTSFSSYFLMFFFLLLSRAAATVPWTLHMPIHAADSTGETIDAYTTKIPFPSTFLLEFPSHGRENCSLSELSLSFYWWKAKKISSVLSQGKNKQRRRRYQAHHY